MTKRRPNWTPQNICCRSFYAGSRGPTDGEDEGGGTRTRPDRSRLHPYREPGERATLRARIVAGRIRDSGEQDRPRRAAAERLDRREFSRIQMAHMYPGQSALVTVDSVPGVTFHGTVDSFEPASGALQALLPPDNATGNFTKVAQRFGIKVILAPARWASIACVLECRQLSPLRWERFGRSGVAHGEYADAGGNADNREWSSRASLRSPPLGWCSWPPVTSASGERYRWRLGRRR